MATIRLYYGRDNNEMVNRLKEAKRGKREVSTVEVRETVLDEDVIEAIVDLLLERRVDTVQLDDCGAYLNKQAIRMAEALGKVKNVRLSEPTFLTQYFLDSLLVAATDLNNLRIQDHLDCRQIESLSSGLKANNTLKTLDLSRSRLDSFSILSNGLEENMGLENLKLRSLGLGDDHVDQMLSAVCNNPSLTCIDLSFNHCRETNGFTEFLKTQKNIREIYLGYQNVWQAPKLDVSGLAQALTTNSSLTVLSLPRNKLNDEDAAMLATALGSNSTLQTLDLRENRIQDNGAVALAETATRRTSGLRKLNLVKNLFEERGVSAYVDAVRQNMNLVQVQLPRPSSCPRVVERVQLGCALNRGGRRFLHESPILTLWPVILERVNVLSWEDSDFSVFEEDTATYRLDVLYHLLQGPALFEELDERNWYDVTGSHYE